MIDSADKTLGRESAMKQATGLMRYLMKRGVRTILFCKVGD
jgi:DEAD/DEAH box helicase domain-containing protein